MTSWTKDILTLIDTHFDNNISIVKNDELGTINNEKITVDNDINIV